MKKLNVGLIENNILHQKRYKKYLDESELSECILAVDSLAKFLKFCQPFMAFDLIFLAIKSSDESELQGIVTLKKELPEVDIILFTDKQDTETIYKSLRLGAVGYLLKGLTKVELERQLLLVKQGGVAISPTIARKIIEYFTPPKRHFIQSVNVQLSRKEKLVATMLLEGLTYREISNNLNISIDGVRYHIKNIYRKLNVNSRAEIHKKMNLFEKKPT